MIGLLAGINFTPSPLEFQSLLKDGQLVPGLEYTTIELTKKEAVSEKYLTTMFQGAAVKQGWPQGTSTSLQFKRAKVNGKPVVIVYPAAAASTKSAFPAQQKRSAVESEGTQSPASMGVLATAKGVAQLVLGACIIIGVAGLLIFAVHSEARGMSFPWWRQIQLAVVWILGLLLGLGLVLMGLLPAVDAGAETPEVFNSGTKAKGRAHIICGSLMIIFGAVCMYWTIDAVSGDRADLFVFWAVLGFPVAVYGLLGGFAIVIESKEKLTGSPLIKPDKEEPADKEPQLRLNKTADVNAKEGKDQTALINAETNGHAKTARVWVAQGADVNAKDKTGTTALMRAAIQGKAEIAETLIANGADVNARDREGRTALMQAVANGWYRTAKILVAQGANVNAQDWNWVTPMIDAIYNAQPHIVELLRNAGAVIPYIKDIDKLKSFFESPAPNGNTRCSDGKCPYATPGDMIRRGEGFLYISHGLVQTRSKTRSMKEVKSNRRKRKLDHATFMEDVLGVEDYRSGGRSLIEEAVFGTGHRTRHGLNEPTEYKSAIHPVLMCQKCAEKRDIVLDAAAQDAWFWWKTGRVPLRTTLTNQELAARVENYGAQEALGEVCMVHVMLTMVVHPDDLLLTDPDNISRWSERILSDEQTKRKLAPHAKTGLIMARGVSVNQAINDLPEQMQKLMKSDGRDPCQYETESFTQDTNRDDVKYVCMIASTKKKR